MRRQHLLSSAGEWRTVSSGFKLNPSCCGAVLRSSDLLMRDGIGGPTIFLNGALGSA